MKKTLMSIVGIVTMFIFVGGFANAELYIYNVFDANGVASDDAYTRILNEYNSNWGYSSSITTTCDAGNSGVVVTSPVVNDGDLYEAPVYRLFFSPYRISELKDGNSNIDVSRVIVKEYTKTADSQNISFNVSTADGLDTNQIYYAFLLPINAYDEIGTPSNEFCFQLTNNMCVQDEACDTLGLVISAPEVEDNTVDANDIEAHGTAAEELDDEQEHNAACAGMNLANVTHTVNGNTITLKWTSLSDGSTVQVAIFDPDEEIYKPLGSAKMDDEKFSYEMKWDGEQNFSLTNGCKEVYYKADANRVTPKEPEKIVPAATGPAENVLYIAIAAIVLYGAYTLFFRKSENK